MPVINEQFKSDFGFESNNFTVDENGNITAKKIDVKQLLIDGNPFVGSDPDDPVVPPDPDDSTIEFPTSFEKLLVKGPFVVRLGDSSEVLTIRDGVVVLASDDGGTIDNIDIGSITPADGTFNNLVVNNQTNIANITVTGTAAVTGTAEFTNNIEISANPTNLNHATRKDYVDTQISAFAIAFGV